MNERNAYNQFIRNIIGIYFEKLVNFTNANKGRQAMAKISKMIRTNRIMTCSRKPTKVPQLDV